MKINDWNFEIEEEFLDKIKNEYNNKNMLPDYENIFLAYQLCSKANTKVVVFGQDPYPNKQDACGLAFSVNRSEKLPKSLINIFKELEADLQIRRKDGDLRAWAKQGVLLLNSSLIVEEGHPSSHSNFGFEKLLEKTIEELNQKKGIIYILLGKHAQKYKLQIGKGNFIIETSHPSPLSAYRGFLGSKIFSKTNQILKNNNCETINWGESYE